MARSHFVEFERRHVGIKVKYVEFDLDEKTASKSNSKYRNWQSEFNCYIWLICSRQNARLTVGPVRTLEAAHAAGVMSAMTATSTRPTTEPASVSNRK